MSTCQDSDVVCSCEQIYNARGKVCLVILAMKQPDGSYGEEFGICIGGDDEFVFNHIL